MVTLYRPGSALWRSHDVSQLNSSRCVATFHFGDDSFVLLLEQNVECRNYTRHEVLSHSFLVLFLTSSLTHID